MSFPSDEVMSEWFERLVEEAEKSLSGQPQRQVTITPYIPTPRPRWYRAEAAIETGDLKALEAIPSAVRLGGHGLVRLACRQSPVDIGIVDHLVRVRCLGSESVIWRFFRHYPGGVDDLDLLRTLLPGISPYRMRKLMRRFEVHKHPRSFEFLRLVLPCCVGTQPWHDSWVWCVPNAKARLRMYMVVWTCHARRLLQSRIIPDLAAVTLEYTEPSEDMECDLTLSPWLHIRFRSQF